MALDDAYDGGGIGNGYGQQNSGPYPSRRPYQNGNGNGNGYGNNNGNSQPSIGRIPPQNLEAEMAVLGAMLLGDRGAIEKATEILTRDDFYRDAHAHLYDAMVTLTEKDEPVDVVTLRNELTRQGILEQIGGVPYIVQLGDIEFTTANIAYYARIVSEKAILRRLIEAAGQIAGLAYGEVEEVGSLVDKAERTIFEVARKRDNQSFAPLRPLLNEAFDKISDTYHEKGMVSGIDTGFDQLNYITSGLQDGDLIIIAARPSMGKCLTASALIDDPLTGERKTLQAYIEEQRPLVSGITECGCVRPAAISHWIDSGIKPVWRVTTRTGRSVEVTGHHPFLTVHGWTPLHDLRVGNKIGVPRRVPVFGSDDTLPMEEVRRIARKVRAEGKPFAPCTWQWDKPRLSAFLSVLLEEEGLSFSKVLASDVQHALTRFGIVALLENIGIEDRRIKIADAKSVETLQSEIGWNGDSEEYARLTSDAFESQRIEDAPNVFWKLVLEAAEQHNPPLGLTKPGYSIRPTLRGRTATAFKKIFYDPNLRRASGQDVYLDEIVSIESIGEQQVYDLTVPDGANFIANDICVHNTSLCLGIGQNAALRTGKSVAIFSLEMSKEQLVQRMICSEARIDAHRLRTGYLDDSDWGKISEAVNRLWDANLFIDDSNDLSSLEMRAKCRRLRAEHGLDLVIVDYLQLMRGHGRSDANRNEEITQIARGLKGLARELKVPVIALAQLSRAVERREDKRPMLSDLRDSGSIEAEADVVGFIYRPAYYERKEAISENADKELESGSRRPGEYDNEESEIIIAKQRNGPTGTVKLAFMPKFARFDNLELGREESPF